MPPTTVNLLAPLRSHYHAIILMICRNFHHFYHIILHQYADRLLYFHIIADLAILIFISLLTIVSHFQYLYTRQNMLPDIILVCATCAADRSSFSAAYFSQYI